MKSAMIPKNSPLRFPCLRTCFHNKGPGRNKFGGKFLNALALQLKACLTKPFYR
jgi:hypothetical protein